MSDFQVARIIAIVMMLVLVGSALVGRRLSRGKLLRVGIAWAAIVALAWAAVLAFRQMP